MKTFQYLTRLTIAALMSGLSAFALFSCNYAEMKDDEAIQAYNDEFPRMPQKTIPVDGGNWVERGEDPKKLVNPLADEPNTVALGLERYRFYCVHCHGPSLDGMGTVGQSFAPLPANLKAAGVQKQSDGELFHKIRFGFNRHPALFATMTDDETWAVLRYLRSVRDGEAPPPAVAWRGQQLN